MKSHAAEAPNESSCVASDSWHLTSFRAVDLGFFLSRTTGRGTGALATALLPRVRELVRDSSSYASDRTEDAARPWDLNKSPGSAWPLFGYSVLRLL